MNSDSKQKIQSIFNDTITQIVELTKKSITITNEPTIATTSATSNEPSTATPGASQVQAPNTNTNQCVSFAQTLTADLIPVLQTFIMNIQIYHTQVFNGIINGVAAQVPTQSIVSQDIHQPSVTNKWTTELPLGSGTSNSSMAGFVDINDTAPIWPMQRERVSDYRPPSYSVASQETRQHWGTRSAHTAPRYSSSALQNHDNYDDFLKDYTTQYENYNTSYVQDSSDEENEDAWKSLDEYTNSMCLESVNLNGLDITTKSIISPSETNPANGSRNCAAGTDGTVETRLITQSLGTDGTSLQCCARLSKYMKYHVIDYPEEFLDSYPPDVYIEKGHVFGKPCHNRVSPAMEEAGIHFCDEHKYDVEVEDIRQPRASSPDSYSNDDVQIEFRNDGYSAATGFGYYNCDNGAADGDADAFFNGIQCCARLNKFRKYQLDSEPGNFLDTYPHDVYIDDGYIYGSACQNLISDDSAKAGIKYCIQHQSDPYVENICEPSGTLNRPTTQISDFGNGNGSEEAEMLGLDELSMQNPSYPKPTNNRNNPSKVSWDLENYNPSFYDLRYRSD